MGEPTNNITIETYNKIKSHPAVDWTIPISLGDSYRGYRVVATDESFYKHYQFYGDKNLEVNSGKWSSGVFDVVLGSQVASALNHQLQDSIVLSHGISDRAVLKHKKTPFKVIGILKPTGTPVDKSLYITLKGMEALHVGWENGAPSFGRISPNRYHEDNLNPDQITSFILRTKKIELPY